MDVTWKGGAEKAFESAGFHNANDPMHNGLSLKPPGWQVRGLHLIIPSEGGNESQVHVDYRKGPAHFLRHNDDFVFNREEFKKWYGALPGLIP